MKTIQAAVDAATTGGEIITIAAGTYPEQVLISGKTNLTLQGVGDDTLIQPAYVVNTAAIMVKHSDNLRIENLKIHTSGDEQQGIWVRGAFGDNDLAVTGLTIQNTTIDVGVASGIVVDASTDAAHSGWLITGNRITSGAVAMSIQDLTDSTISGNKLTAGISTNVLWTSERFNLSNLVFTNNIINGSGGSQVTFLTDYNTTGASNVPPEGDPGFDSSINGVIITGNTFDTYGSRPLRIGAGVSDVFANENKFLAPNLPNGGIQNESVSTIDATRNWWGTSISSEIDAKTTGTGAVTYDPWYVDAGMNTTNVVAPAPVTSPTLGEAGAFGVLSSTFMNSNTSPQTIIKGDVGYTVAGQPITQPLTVNGTLHPADATFDAAGIAQGTALTILNNQSCTTITGPLNATKIGSNAPGVFPPGCYTMAGDLIINLSTSITLDLTAPGGAGSTWIFKSTGGGLTTGADSFVTLTHGASASNVFWAPVAATNIGAYTGALPNTTKLFTGTIIDASGISLGHFANLSGRALAFGGTVTTDANTITVPGVVVDIIHPTIISSTINTVTKTIVYTLSEPIRFVSQANPLTITQNPAGLVKIYTAASYLNRQTGDPEPKSFGGANTATLNGNVLTINYTDTLSTDSYLVDTWGYTVTDLAGNQLSESTAGIFTADAPIPSHGNSSGSRPATPAVPAKVQTPDGCEAGNKFSTTTGRNCNAATPAVPAGQVLGASTQAGQVLGAEKFNFTKFLKFKAGSYKVSLQGAEVIELQKLLTSLGYDLGIADGKFGPKTEGAVIKFQISKGLKGDGVVGTLTRAELNK